MPSLLATELRETIYMHGWIPYRYIRKHAWKPLESPYGSLWNTSQLLRTCTVGGRILV